MDNQTPKHYGWTLPAFDEYAFEGNRPKAVSPATRLSFQDFDGMHIQKRRKQQVRRLPTPDWAKNDVSMRALVLEALEARLYLRDSRGTDLERMARVDQEARNRLPAKRAQLEGMLRRYNEAGAAGASAERLRKIAIEVQNVDSEIMMIERGLTALMLAVVYYYYRLGWNSVSVAEELGVKPPMVRIWLYRLNSLADGRRKTP
jgi:hypothetical protein